MSTEDNFADNGQPGELLTTEARGVIHQMVESALKFRIPKLEDAKKLGLETINYESKPMDQIYNREVNGIATDVVVFDFINSAEKTYNFMNIVCIFFNEAIDYYCEKMGLVRSTEERPGDVYFMYKGGNVLRLLYNEFKRSIPVTAVEIADGFFAKSFKKSDSDFSIFVNPGLPNFDRVYDDMVSLSYVLQYRIRTVFNREPKGDMFDVFAFAEYNNEKRDLILRKMLDDLNASASVSDPSNEDFYGAKFTKVKMMGHEYRLVEDNDNEYVLDEDKADASMLTDDADKRADFAIDKCGADICVYGLGTPNDADYFYISANHALDLSMGFPGNEVRFRFTLVRTKLNASTYMIKDGQKKLKLLGGEVIDCTIMHRDTLGLSTTEEFDEYKNNVSSYSLSMPDTKYRLKFFGYNRVGLIHDLEFILFRSVQKPWEDNKYAKRLNRLFFLYMVDLFANEINNEKRVDIVEKYRVGAIETLRRLFDSESADPNHYDRVIDNVDVFDTQIAMNTSVAQLQRIARASRSPEDQEKLKQMLDTIDENTRYMLDILNDVERHINSDATYEESYVRAPVSDMAGGHRTGIVSIAGTDSALSTVMSEEFDIEKIFDQLRRF